MSYVTAWVETEGYCTRELDSNDEWDRGDYGETLVGYGVSLPGVDCPSYQSVAVALDELGFSISAGDEVFLVIESYGSGCTFGCTNPQYQPKKIFPCYESAYAWTVSPEGIAAQDNDYFGGHNEYVIESVRVQGPREETCHA